MCWSSNYSAQSEIIESLHNELAQSQNAQDSIHWLNELSWEMAQIYELETALVYGEKAKELSLNVGSLQGLASAYSRLGTVYYNMSYYEQALINHKTSLKLKEYIGDKKGMASSAQNIGNIYQGQTKIKEAIYYYMLSLRIKEEIEDKKGVGNTLNSLGNVYKDQGKYDKAIQLYNEALSIRKEIGDSVGIGYSLSNIGIAYGMAGNMPPALKYTLESLEILQRTGDLIGEAACYTSLALIYQYLDEDNDLTKSIHYHTLSLSLYEKMQDKRGVAMAYTNIGNLYSTINQNAVAEEFLLKGLQLAIEIEVLDYIKGTYFNLYQFYEKIGDSKNAIFHLKEYDAIKDRIYQDETSFLLEEKLAHHKQVKKDSEMTLQLAQIENENLQNKARIERQYLLLLFVGIVALILVVFSIFYYKSNQTQKKANKQLLLQKQTIEQKNKENETLMSEIHHRVKNNLQVISSLLSLQGKYTEDKELQLAIVESQQRVKSMELVHKMLYEGYVFNAIPLHEYIKELSNLVVSVFQLGDDEVIVNIQADEVVIDIENLIPVGLILNELLTNSLKHISSQNANVCIDIMCSITNEKVEIVYIDNGKIIDEPKNVNNPSFGMKLVGLLIKQLGAELTIEKAEGLRYLLRMPQSIKS